MLCATTIQLANSVPGIVGWNEDSGDNSAWESFKARISSSSSSSSSSTTSTSTATMYYVQVGAFSVKSNAENYLATVKNDYPSAFIKTVDSMYYVQVGAFSSKENAENYLASVKEKYSGAFIKVF